MPSLNHYRRRIYTRYIGVPALSQLLNDPAIATPKIKHFGVQVNHTEKSFPIYFQVEVGLACDFIPTFWEHAISH